MEPIDTTEVQESIHLDIDQSDSGQGSNHLNRDQIDPGLGQTQSGPTLVEPQNSIPNSDSSAADSNSAGSPVQAPEKKLTLFALRLAVLEKIATGFGALGFIWATVVLLGGFAITLDKTDFWFITVILLIEGARIFSRSHELEWQHQATWSNTDAGINSLRTIRSTIMVFLLRNVSRLLYWPQLASALTCVVLSSMKLIRRNFGEVSKSDTDKRNREWALIIFYCSALAEALLFLIEKAYWEWKVTFGKFLHEVDKEYEFGPSGMVSIKRFFYDAYSKCVYGSIFDGLRMDMVTFGMELLASNSPDEQLIGVRILRQFAASKQFSDNTLLRIGITISVMERLVEMLNWTDLKEEEIRWSAGQILSQLAGKKQNSLRVAGITGAMESIYSLFHVERNCVGGAADKKLEKEIVFDDKKNHGFRTFTQLGLLILKNLIHDHNNCGKIANKRGLLPKIIDFTHAGERMLKKDMVTAESQILTVKLSLQVVKILVSTTGATGKKLRQKISEVVFTISNIRDILLHGGKYPVLQGLGIEILTSLALDEYATKVIGETGGVLTELFDFFSLNNQDDHVRTSAAGEALAMLAADSESICHRLLRMNVVEKLVPALKIPLLRVNAAWILRDLGTYIGEDCSEKLKLAAPTVLTAIREEDVKLQEVMVGLAPHVFKFLKSDDEASKMFYTAEIQKELAERLVEILKTHGNPAVKVPRIRRFSIELAIWMMEYNETNIQSFWNLGMEKELDSVTKTTSELENFNIFSGGEYHRRYSTTIHSLVEIAIKLMKCK